MKKSKLKKRLRKKYHGGEFQEFGFQFLVKFQPNLSEDVDDKFWHEFVREIERHKLMFGGGGDVKRLQGFVTSSENYQSPTPVQREIIKKWFESRVEIATGEVGNLVDAWYDVK